MAKLTFIFRVIEEVTNEQWKNYVVHTNRLILESWENAKVYDASEITPLIISDNNNEELSSDSENSESELED